MHLPMKLPGAVLSLLLELFGKSEHALILLVLAYVN